MHIQEIRLRNFLSFGPEAEPIPCEKLNVMIGPNGSGKSNFIAALKFMSGMHDDLDSAARKVGSPRDFFWNKIGRRGIISFDFSIYSPSVFRYFVEMISDINNSENFGFLSEKLEYKQVLQDDSEAKGSFERFENSKLVRIIDPSGFKPVQVKDFSRASILSYKYTTLSLYEEIDLMRSFFQSVVVYDEWYFGDENPMRHQRPADEKNNIVNHSFSNVGLVLSKYKKDITAKNKLVSHLNDIYAEVDGYEIITEGNTVQIFLTEGDHAIPATRLSDGTLRYLALLAILCDPNPPPVICIEEPELGLHPDVVATLGRLLLDASERTQLFVTTHSEALITALQDHPECILVCEKDENGTHMKRLDADELKPWLEEYSLGDLWTKGQIGGNRW